MRASSTSKGFTEPAALPQPVDVSSLEYRYVPYDRIGQLFFRSNNGSSLLDDDTLVWVCKSKGRRRRRSNKSDEEALLDLSTKNDEEDGWSKKNQRLELFLRARTRGLVENTSSGSSADHLDRRIRVEYPLGSTYNVRPSHLVPVLEQQRQLVLVVPETSLYRRLCVVHTLPNETFVEIGCDAGLTVRRVWETGDAQRTVLGIDKSEPSIRDAKRRYSELQECFWQWDILNQQEAPPPMLRALAPDAVVAVDINGNRPLEAVLACLEALFQRWQPRLVIVKSRELYGMLANAK